mgnify:CR=1 FL=1
MKRTYKGCDITVTREKALAGYDMLFYSVFDNGYEVTSGFCDSADKVKDFMQDMCALVDDYREHPEQYE